MARPSRIPTAEERALWRTAMRDAVPFHPPDEPVAEVAEAPSPVIAVRPASASLPAAPLPAAPPPARLPALEPGRSAGLDRRTDERLRRGRLPVEGRIDLHGLTQAAAYDALASFIAISEASGRRCVLVITGKGAVGSGGGVLRTMVPRWLAEPSLRRRILALHRAQPRDGGDGALYVLLRRRRPAPE